MIVYCATSPSGKKYVGQTINSLAFRRAQHERDHKSQSIFAKAIRKYGDKIKWRVVAKADSIAELNKLEIHYIAKLNTITPHGYNLREGGEGGRHSEVAIVNMRESAVKRWAATPAAERKAIGKKIGEANARRVVSAETCAKMRGKRKPHTAAAKRKIGKSQAARWAARKAAMQSQ